MRRRPVYVVTQVEKSDIERRQRRYLVLMGIRTLCVLGLLVVPGWWKVALMIGAVGIPMVAVIGASTPRRLRQIEVLIPAQRSIGAHKTI